MQSCGDYYDYHGALLVLHPVEEPPVRIVEHLKVYTRYSHIYVALTVPRSRLVETHPVKYGLSLHKKQDEGYIEQGHYYSGTIQVHSTLPVILESICLGHQGVEGHVHAS